MANEPKMVTMDVDDFISVFKPVKNHLQPNSSWDGCMFETYGQELDYVAEKAKTKPETVWTITDADGRQVITNGLVFVNRIGYLITEKAASANAFYEVTDPDDDELDD